MIKCSWTCTQVNNLDCSEKGIDADTSKKIWSIEPGNMNAEAKQMTEELKSLIQLLWTSIESRCLASVMGHHFKVIIKQKSISHCFNLIQIDKKLTIWYAINAESRGSPPDKAECG